MLRVLISSFIIFSLLHINLPLLNSNSGRGELISTAYAGGEDDVTSGDDSDPFGISEYMCNNAQCGDDWGGDYTTAGMISMITMIIGALLMGIFWGLCPWAPDLIIANIFVIIFFIMELINAQGLVEDLDKLRETELLAGSYKKGQEEGATDEEKKTITVEYTADTMSDIKEAFITARTALQDTQDRIKQRKTAIDIFTIGEVVAGSIALIGEILMDIPPLSTWAIPLFSCYVSGVQHSPNIKNPFDNIREPIFPQQYEENFVAMISQTKDEGKIYFLFKEWTSLFKEEIRSSFAGDNYSDNEALVGDLIPSKISLKQTLLTAIRGYSFLAANKLMPQAFAQDPPPEPTKDYGEGTVITNILGGIGIGASVLAMLISVTTTAQAGLGKALGRPGLRAFIHWAFAIPSLIAGDFAQKAVNKIGERIAAYDAIITNFETIANVSGINQSPYYDDYSGYRVNPDGTIETPTHTPPKPCTGQLASGKECSKGIGVKYNKKNFNSFAGGNLLSNTMNSAQNASDSAYAGNMAGVLAAKDEMNNNAAGLKKLRVALEKQLEKKKIKNPLRKLDKHKKLFVAKIKKLGTDTYNSMSESQRNSFARAVSAPPSQFEKKIAKMKTKNKQVAAIIKKKEATTPGFNFDFALEEPTVAPEAVDNGLAKDEEFVYDKGDDINKENDVSLFKIIENRYKKNAYPLFFDEM